MLRKIKLLAAAFTAASVFISLCGCNSDENLKEAVYHIYSNGTFIDGGQVEFDFSDDGDSADFYIPDGMVNNSVSRDFLTADELDLYDEILGALGSFEERIPLKNDASVYAKVLELIRFEQLAYSQVSRRYSDINSETQLFEVYFEYRFDGDELSRMNMASENAAKQIMEGITDDMDDYEKLKYFHDLRCAGKEKGSLRGICKSVFIPMQFSGYRERYCGRRDICPAYVEYGKN